MTSIRTGRIRLMIIGLHRSLYGRRPWSTGCDIYFLSVAWCIAPASGHATVSCCTDIYWCGPHWWFPASSAPVIGSGSVLMPTTFSWRRLDGTGDGSRLRGVAGFCGQSLYVSRGIKLKQENGVFWCCLHYDLA